MDKQTENKKLIEQYPFLLHQHNLSGTYSIGFESTVLDDMPVGWRAAFGEDLCKEIMEELVRSNCVDSYQVLQIKEKYGELRWYSQGGTERIHRAIVPKYEKLSRRICIQCGQPATLVSQSWIAPWCNTCAGQLPRHECVDIDATYSPTDGDGEPFFAEVETSENQKNKRIDDRSCRR